MQTEAPIILFDGVCNLCNASVQFILKYEKKPIFRFGTLQTENVQKLLHNFNDEIISDSVLLIENGKLYQKSTAALRIAKQLRYFWPLYYFIYIPKFLRNPIYEIVARNRYSWFGRQNSCMIPDPKLKSRFI